MYHVDINDAQSRIETDLDRLRAVTEDVLRHEEVRAAEISIALIDGETMQRLNRDHLGHDYDTDVLSFLLDVAGPDETPDGSPRGAGKTLDGEILISGDVVAAMSPRFGWSDEDEALLYLVHGLLHLAGYDDLTDDEKSLMRDRERYHLARWGLSPAYHEADDAAGDAEASERLRDTHTGVRD